MMRNPPAPRPFLRHPFESNEGPAMTTSTRDDRQKELHALLDQVRAHPERDWSEVRARIDILNRMLASEARAEALQD